METSCDLVTFITDYGLSGGFVGMMHAVVDSMTGGNVRLLDIDHSIPPQDVLLGALRLERALGYCRPGVHVAVVDPGVGGSRRAIALQAGDRVFIGPDNGLLLPAAAAAGGIERAVSIEEQLPPTRSRTFDGRDVFAPAAAHVANGTALGALGPDLDPAQLVALELPGPRERPDGSIEVVVVQVDGFGNVQFACEGRLIEGLGKSASISRLPATGAPGLVVPVAGTFADVPVGSALLLEDSDGCLALSVNRGRADLLLGLSPGDRVLCEPVA